MAYGKRNITARDDKTRHNHFFFVNLLNLVRVDDRGRTVNDIRLVASVIGEGKLLAICKASRHLKRNDRHAWKIALVRDGEVFRPLATGKPGRDCALVEVNPQKIWAVRARDVVRAEQPRIEKLPADRVPSAFFVNLCDFVRFELIQMLPCDLASFVDEIAKRLCGRPRAGIRHGVRVNLLRSKLDANSNSKRQERQKQGKYQY